MRFTNVSLLAKGEHQKENDPSRFLAPVPLISSLGDPLVQKSNTNVEN